MSRAILLIAGAATVLLVLSAFQLELGEAGGSGDMLGLGIGAPVASAALIGLLAGFVGAAIANRLNIGRRGHDARLNKRIDALARQREIARPAAASPPLPPPPPPPPAKADWWAPERPSDPALDYDRGRPEPQASPEPTAPPPLPEPAEAQAQTPYPPPEPRRGPVVPNLTEISAAYSRIVSGQISRSAFADFFDRIGRSGPVEIADGGLAIGPASGESFLTSVNAGAAFLVFPSYDFIANQATQFATIASVPESVAAVFALERGDGELILERPAIYEETETGLRRVEKGEIRGFGG